MHVAAGYIIFRWLAVTIETFSLFLWLPDVFGLTKADQCGVCIVYHNFCLHIVARDAVFIRIQEIAALQSIFVLIRGARSRSLLEQAVLLRV